MASHHADETSPGMTTTASNAPVLAIAAGRSRTLLRVLAAEADQPDHPVAYSDSDADGVQFGDRVGRQRQVDRGGSRAGALETKCPG
jgi:hypothetical protein